MKASEGKLGRVFLLHLEGGEDAVKEIETFAANNGIVAAQVTIMTGKVIAGILAPDAQEVARFHPAGFASGDRPDWTNADILIQELHGLRFRRVVDPESGKEILTKVPASKSRVMEKAAPAPEVAGPGTVPVYLFNAEFN